MKLSSMSRQVLRPALVLGTAALLTACVSLFPGETTPQQVWYELSDFGAHASSAVPPQVGKAKERTLLIGPVASSSFYDGSMLAYSADGRTRAYYQFAAWTERPAKRLGALVEKRLAERGGFAGVAQSTSGVRGELVLNLRLDECFHDASIAPGQAHLSFTAELIDWRSRSLLARRTFAGRAPVIEANAPAAAAALSQALATQLDELSTWVESAAASMPQR